MAVKKKINLEDIKDVAPTGDTVKRTNLGEDPNKPNEQVKIVPHDQYEAAHGKKWPKARK